MKVLVLYSLTLSSIISIICLATGCSSQPFDNNPTISSSLFSSKTFARRTRNPPILASSRVPNRRLPTDETFPASFMEIRPGTVRFARVKPMLTSQNNNNFFSEINHERNRHQRNRHSRRRKRYSVRPEVSRRSPEDVCKSVSDWVLKTEAVDPNGNAVHVLQRIPINGTQVNQYFYETMCVPDLIYEEDDIFGTTYRRSEDSRNSECNGIDKSKWSSVCKESYVWTYAKVMTFEGEIGWSWIPIKGSCGCAIWPIDPPETTTERGRRISSSKSVLSLDKTSSKSSGVTSRTLVNRNVEKDPFL